MLLFAVCVIDSALKLWKERSETRTQEYDKTYLSLNVILSSRVEFVECDGGWEISYPVFERREVGDDRG